MAIEKSVDQVQIARSAAAGAYGEIARQVGFGARCEGGHLFVSPVHPFDISAASHDIGQAVEAIAHNAEYALDSGRHQGIYELIRDASTHLSCSMNPLRLRCLSW